MSLVASTRGLALMPAYAKNLLPWSVVSRPLEGEAPTIDLAVGYSNSNTSPILKLFLSRIEELTDRISSEARPMSGPIGRRAAMTRVQTVAAGPAPLAPDRWSPNGDFAGDR
jgi:hypothetical protein